MNYLLAQQCHGDGLEISQGYRAGGDDKQQPLGSQCQRTGATRAHKSPDMFTQS